jgi:hypothetical protein
MVKWLTSWNHNANVIHSKTIVIRSPTTHIGFIYKYLNNCFQHVFINNNHWILIKIHASIPNYIALIIWFRYIHNEKISYDTIQLLTNIINIEHLLYTYVNMMQQIDDSFSDFFTIIYVTDIAFGLNLEQYIYNVTQMWFHSHNNIINKNISPFSQTSTTIIK